MFDLSISGGNGPLVVPGANKLLLREAVAQNGDYGYQCKVVFEKQYGEKALGFYFNMPSVKAFDPNDNKSVFKFKLKFNELAKALGVTDVNKYQPSLDSLETEGGLATDEGCNEFYSKFCENILSEFRQQEFEVALHYKKDTTKLVVPRSSENTREDGKYTNWVLPFLLSSIGNVYVSPELNFVKGEEVAQDAPTTSEDILPDLEADPFA